MEREPLIRRVLVALDASPSSLAVLEAAARLAETLRAELSGLFVEDENLLRIAELPFARAVESFSGTPRPLESRGLERGLRAEASRARRALEIVAERGLLRWSFRVTRGTVASEILAAASEANLLVLGKAGWSASRLGPTASTVARSASGPTLMVGREARVGTTVVAYDGSPASERALTLAAALSREESLTVVSIEPRASFTAEKWLADQRRTASILELPQGDRSALVEVVRREGAGLLLVPVGDSWRDEVALAALVQIECPVLLVP